MQVDDSLTRPIDKDHFIEFGKSSWDVNEESIRRRKNNASGGYDPISSSEISIAGHANISVLIAECLKHDKIPEKDMRMIFKCLNDSAASLGITL